MKKPTDKPIKHADLKEYLDKFDDFRLELEVLHKARRFGFDARHAGTYEDPVTQKPRQFDIRASLDADQRRIVLAIECKNLNKSYPLLASRVPRTDGESLHYLIHGPKTEHYPRARIARSSRYGLYKEGELVAKTLRQVGRDHQGEITHGDDVFDKWSQALASSSELIEAELDRHANSGRMGRRAFVMPVLVIPDDTLWVADYQVGEAGYSGPIVAPETTFFVGRGYSFPDQGGSTYTITHLHIVTLSYVDEFFENLTTSDEVRAAIFSHDA